MYVCSLYNFHSACQWHVFGNTNNTHSSTTQLETILQHLFLPQHLFQGQCLLQSLPRFMDFMQGLRWQYTEWVWPTKVSSTFHHARRLWILQAKDEKQRESWKTTYLKTVHTICTNSDVRIAKVYTHSNQKSHQECSKQLTTGYHSYLLNKY